MADDDEKDYENISKLTLPIPPSVAKRLCSQCCKSFEHYKQLKCAHSLCLTCYDKQQASGRIACLHPTCAYTSSNVDGHTHRAHVNDHPGSNTFPRQTSKDGHDYYNTYHNGSTNGTLNGHTNLKSTQKFGPGVSTKDQGKLNGAGGTTASDPGNKMNRVGAPSVAPISTTYEEVNCDAPKPSAVNKVGNHNVNFDNISNHVNQPKGSRGATPPKEMWGTRQQKPSGDPVSQSMVNLATGTFNNDVAATGRGRGGGNVQGGAARFMPAALAGAAIGGQLPVSPVSPISQQAESKRQQAAGRVLDSNNNTYVSPLFSTSSDELPAAAHTAATNGIKNKIKSGYIGMTGIVPLKPGDKGTADAAGNKANGVAEKTTAGISINKSSPDLNLPLTPAPYANIFAGGAVTCEQCGKQKSDQYCQDCPKYMCQPCCNAHSKHPKSAKHMVVSCQQSEEGGGDSAPGSASPAGSSSSLCAIHKREPTKYYCFPCQKLFCTFCNVDGVHASHEVATIAAAETKCRSQLGKYTKMAEDELKMVEDAQKKLALRRLNEQQKYDNAILETRARAVALLAAVEEWQKRNLATIEHEHASSVEYLDVADEAARSRQDSLAALLLRTQQTPSAPIALAQVVPAITQIMQPNNRLSDPEVEVCKLKPGSLDLTIEADVTTAFGKLDIDDDSHFAYINM